MIPGGNKPEEYYAKAVHEARYEFAKFKGRRHDLLNLPDQLLASPPNRIIQYAYKDEVINYILDKAFIELPLKIEHLEAIEQCFAQRDHRETFLAFIERDYRSYELKYLQPQLIEQRNLRVVLPVKIYNNILDLFHCFLASLKKDIMAPLAALSSTNQSFPDLKTDIHQLLRLLLFSKLFVRESTSPSGSMVLPTDPASQQRQRMAPGQSGSVTTRQLQKDLARSEIW